MSIHKFAQTLMLFILMFFGVSNAFALGKDTDFFENGISKEVKERFMSATIDHTQEWVPAFIDSLKECGSKKGGEAYKCLADVLTTYEHMYASDSLKFEESWKVASKEAKDLHSYRIYFNLLANRVAFYASRSDYFNAQRTTDMLIDETEKIGDASGMVNGYLCLGLLLSERKEYQESNNKYLKAIESSKKVHGDQRVLIAQLQYLIANNLSLMGSYTQAIDYAKRSIKTLDSEPDTRVCIAYCYYKQGLTDEFMKAYDRIPKQIMKEGKWESDTRYEYLTAVRYALKGDFDQALLWCDSIENNMVKYSALAEVNKHMGNWEKAFTYYQRSRELNDSVLHADYKYMIASADRELDAMKELQAKEEEVKKSRTIVTYAFIAIILMLLVVVAAMWINIAQRKKSQQRINNMLNENNKLAIAKENAEVVSNTKTAFVQNMSHDVRTPLNAIIGFAQLLGLPDGANTEEEKAEYNMHIMNCAEMLMMLLDDILNIGDIEKGNFAINKTETKCNDMCHKILKTVEYRVPFAVELKYTSNVPDDYTVLTDSKRVQQVLTNFLTNACKHTSQGEIVLDCNVDEAAKTVKFSVTDTGEGVSEDIRHDLFNRFVHRGTSDSHGIGLDICKTIADKMDGSVGLDMDYYDGARFYFMLQLEKK